MVLVVSWNEKTKKHICNDQTLNIVLLVLTNDNLETCSPSLHSWTWYQILAGYILEKVENLNVWKWIFMDEPN